MELRNDEKCITTWLHHMHSWLKSRSPLEIAHTHSSTEKWINTHIYSYLIISHFLWRRSRLHRQILFTYTSVRIGVDASSHLTRQQNESHRRRRVIIKPYLAARMPSVQQPAGGNRQIDALQQTFLTCMQSCCMQRYLPPSQGWHSKSNPPAYHASNIVFARNKR